MNESVLAFPACREPGEGDRSRLGAASDAGSSGGHVSAHMLLSWLCLHRGGTSLLRLTALTSEVGTATVRLAHTRWAGAGGLCSQLRGDGVGDKQGEPRLALGHSGCYQPPLGFNLHGDIFPKARW